MGEARHQRESNADAHRKRQPINVNETLHVKSPTNAAQSSPAVAVSSATDADPQRLSLPSQIHPGACNQSLKRQLTAVNDTLGDESQELSESKLKLQEVVLEVARLESESERLALKVHQHDAVGVEAARMIERLSYMARQHNCLDVLLEGEIKVLLAQLYGTGNAPASEQRISPVKEARQEDLPSVQCNSEDQTTTADFSPGLCTESENAMTSGTEETGGAEPQFDSAPRNLEPEKAMVGWRGKQGSPHFLPVEGNLLISRARPYQKDQDAVREQATTPPPPELTSPLRRQWSAPRLARSVTQITPRLDSPNPGAAAMAQVMKGALLTSGSESVTQLFQPSSGTPLSWSQMSVVHTKVPPTVVSTSHPGSRVRTPSPGPVPASAVAWGVATHRPSMLPVGGVSVNAASAFPLRSGSMSPRRIVASTPPRGRPIAPQFLNASRFGIAVPSSYQLWRRP